MGAFPLRGRQRRIALAADALELVGRALPRIGDRSSQGVLPLGLDREPIPERPGLVAFAADAVKLLDRAVAVDGNLVSLVAKPVPLGLRLIQSLDQPVAVRQRCLVLDCERVVGVLGARVQPQCLIALVERLNLFVGHPPRLRLRSISLGSRRRGLVARIAALLKQSLAFGRAVIVLLDEPFALDDSCIPLRQRAIELLLRAGETDTE